ncbi:MAG: phosphotransferase family protein, partial [Acidimicrobiales bacterium]
MSTDLPVDPFSTAAEPETAPVRDGEDLDWDSVEVYLREHLPADVDTSGDFAVVQFPNGAANLTYLISFGSTELVLRRPPFGTLAPGAHDMAREFNVLSKLWRRFDLAPKALIFCDDDSVAGADFFIMERRRGEVIRGVIPETMRGHEDVGRRVGLALARAMASLHLLDPAACGLSDLGRPDGFVERQVGGWKKRWDLVADDRYDAAMTEIHSRLEASLPRPQRVSFVHNDLKLDNCMVDPLDPDRIVAIFDWDMTTLGDPLVDLGTLLNYWPDPGDPADAVRGTHDGMDAMGLPTRDEMRRVYAAAAELELAQLAWYEAFAQWKTVTIMQQLYRRWELGESTDERMAEMADD